MSVRRREKIFKSDCTVINNPIQTLQNVNKVSLGANKLNTCRREDVDIKLISSLPQKHSDGANLAVINLPFILNQWDYILPVFFKDFGHET